LLVREAAMAKFLCAVLLFYLCGCAGTSHRAPAPGDADVIAITPQWLAAQRRQQDLAATISAHVPGTGGPAAAQLPAPPAGRLSAPSADRLPVPPTERSPAPSAERLPAVPTERSPAPAAERLPAVPTERSPAPAAERLPALPTDASGAYRLGVGDVLAITVWDHPELTGAVPRQDNLDGQTGPPAASFVIDQQGQLHFPFAGAVPLAGLTRDQARDLLAQRLARYFRAPRVTLNVQVYRSQRVYVDGEVKTPGPQAINDIPMTVLEALNRAGGLLPTADQSRIIIERGGQLYRVNLAAPRQGGAGPLPSPRLPPHPATLLLADGDVVRAPPRDESKVFVGGEVLSPRALTMHDGRLTLNEALGEAGGLNPQSADAGQVYVVRQRDGVALVYRLDARPASALALAEQFELRPRDVVYVAASPLTNWHRAISQLFPGELSSAVGVTTRP
jgi:polysaccharide export outer membrane protein